MGNQNKKTEQATQRNQLKSFNKHQIFAQCKILQDKDQNVFYQVSHSIANKNIYKAWMTTMQKFQKQANNNQRFLLLPIQSSYIQQGMCGSAGILKIKFDYFPFTLSQQISNRHDLNQPFNQNQVWYLLYVLIQSAYEFHKNNQTLGDIRSENVFVNQNGDVALHSLLTLPDTQTNYFKTFIHKEITYLPPEGMKDIQTGKQSPTYNQQLGQSFSIGLTLLDATLLYNCGQLYNKSLSFNEAKLKQLIKEFNKLQFSEPLKIIIEGLLRTDLKQRLKTDEILEYLKKYEQQICNLKQFSPQPLPNSVQYKLKTDIKKPSSRVIHLSNGSAGNNIQINKSKFLQTTQFPIWTQNSSEKLWKENSTQKKTKQNYVKPQIYSFIDPSQFNYENKVYQTGNVQISANQNNKNVKYNYPQQNYQKEQQNKGKNKQIRNQIQNDSKFKSNFLNNYAKQSQNLLKQYERRVYQQVKKNQPTLLAEKQSFKDYPSTQKQKDQKYTLNNTNINPNFYKIGQSSFGTGHLSNNLTNMGRITTSITPNADFIHQTQNHTQNKKQIHYYDEKDFNKYSQKFEQSEKRPQYTKNYYSGPYNNNTFQDNRNNLNNYKPNTNGNILQTKHQQIFSYPTGNPYHNNITSQKKDIPIYQQRNFYLNQKHQFSSLVPTTNNYNNYDERNYSNYSSQFKNLNEQKNSQYTQQYNDIFRAIDKQLEQSRKMYPGS